MDEQRSITEESTTNIPQKYAKRRTAKLKGLKTKETASIGRSKEARPKEVPESRKREKDLMA